MKNSYEDITTTDLSKFSRDDLRELRRLLVAMEKGLPSDFEDEGVVPVMNLNSGFVYLENSLYQACMLPSYGKELKSWYCLPNGGSEGFIENLLDDFKGGYIDEEDYPYLADLAESNGYKDEAKKIREVIDNER